MTSLDQEAVPDLHVMSGISLENYAHTASEPDWLRYP